MLFTLNEKGYFLRHTYISVFFYPDVLFPLCLSQKEPAMLNDTAYRSFHSDKDKKSYQVSLDGSNC